MNDDTANSKSNISVQKVSLPKGGGAIRGLGETFGHDEFTGTNSLVIPIYTTPSREHSPQLSLNYESSMGNGPYGVGFHVSLQKISRKTSLGIPKYDHSDIFIGPAGELTPKLEKPVRTEGSWTTHSYLPRVESDFSQILFWVNGVTGESYWETINKENVTTTYGKSQSARIVDPDDETKIFEWLIEESYDAKGNKVQYSYQSEDNANVTPTICETNRSMAQKYISDIRYGNYYQDDEEKFAFAVVFDYGQYDVENIDRPNSDPYTPVGKWRERSDPFSHYRSGFEIRTYRLCRNILLFHDLKELGDNPCLVRAMRLAYRETPTFSFLTSVSKTGYRQNQDGSYTSKSLPPLEFSYSQFSPSATPVFKNLSIDGNETITGYLDRSGFEMVDLNGEGLPGLLYDDEHATRYYEPCGNGVYESPATALTFPSTKDLQNPAIGLRDINSDGKLEWVVSDSSSAGYYDRVAGTWGNFKSFTAIPGDLANPAAYYVDLDGDGQEDLMLFDERDLIFYESLGKEGFSAAKRIPMQEGFPIAVENGERELVGHANIFGDGLPHRFRIRDGEIAVWPNLGYGRFGEKITLGNSPRFSETTKASRIFFADLDGSGTTDVIFAYADKIEIYLNQSGNSFADPMVVILPELFSDIDRIGFGDVLGHGTPALIFTKAAPQTKHYYFNFCGENTEENTQSLKPYLLNKMDNNLGTVTQIEYAASTKFYLEDKKAGRPWPTNLPFPVQVVAKTITTDQVSGSKTTRCYKYHDGYYDSVEKVFGGFGFVESVDTETFEEFSETGQNTDLYVLPTLTKTWFHTGAYLESGSISKHYQEEYFSGDPQAYHLPDTEFAPAILQSDPETIRQAYYALKGSRLRQEIYALDAEENPTLAENPYSVIETNYIVNELQALGGQKYAAFYVHQREEIEYEYERNPHDPRVQHDFVLQLDDFGNVEKSCTVFYGRRPNSNPDVYVYPEQSQLRANVHVSQFINVTTDFRMIGISCDDKAFEVEYLDLQGQNYFTFDTIQAQVEEALQNQIPYGSPFDASVLQARLFSWKQSYFWDQAQQNPLPLGQISARDLLHHRQSAVFSETFLQNTYGTKVTADELSQNGGYFKDSSDNWWNKGLVQYYFTSAQPEKFYLPNKTENYYGENASPTQADGLLVQTIIDYDEPYFLVPVKVTESISDAVQTIQSAEIDYYTFAPRQTTDMNEVIQQALFDPLGMVIATSIFKEAHNGTPRDGDGDLAAYKVQTDASFQNVLDDGHKYLQEATDYFYYNLFSWRDEGQPACAITLRRQTHVSDLQNGEKSPIEVSIEYSDGLGRAAETKSKAEPGITVFRDSEGKLLRDAKGKPILAEAQERWIVSGRTVYNNKGKETEKYQPYYSNTSEYESQQDIIDEKLVPPPTVTYYDPLSRAVQIDTPKRFFSKIEFTAWQEKHFDENDTVLDSYYYIEFKKDYPTNPTQEQKDENDALDKAAKFYNTQSTTVLDNAGHVIRTIEDNLGNVAPDAFADIVKGSSVTSQQLWDDLVANGYLQTDAKGTWTTGKFQAYVPGFSLETKYPQFASPVTELLLQSCLTTFQEVDIEGRVLKTIDPRLYYANVKEGKNNYNFIYAYAMDGEDELLIDNIDAGKRWKLINIFQSAIATWDSRNTRVDHLYDRLQRLVTTDVSENDGSSYRVEKVTYGDGQTDAAQNNLWGEIYEHNDQAGVVINEKYNLQGQVGTATRQLLQDYKQHVNWNGSPPLQSETYRTQWSYDALKRITSEITADDSNYQPQYFISGRLKSIAVTWKNGTTQNFIANIAYDANNLKLLVERDNQAQTLYTYEETTLRLTKIYSSKSAQILQNMTYSYDPVGNVVLKRDQTQQAVFCHGQQAIIVGNYTYDALYRLIGASGYQHPGIDTDTHINGFKQSLYASLCPADANDVVKMESYQENFAYDNSGNLVTNEHVATSQSFTRTNTVQESSNQLTDVEYDGNGNSQSLNLGSSVALSWDYRNSLTSASKDSEREYFVYDYAGKRARRVIERLDQGTVTEVEQNIYLGNYQVKLVNQSTPEETILHRETLRVMDEESCAAIVHYWVVDESQPQRTNERELRYQLSEYLGSVAVEVDEKGDITSYEEYFPYGGTSVIAGNDQGEVQLKDYRYSGKECDDGTGLYYYGARYYAPWLGRWISPDPAGSIDGLNLYAFVEGNPLTMVDIGGLAKRKFEGRKDTRKILRGITKESWHDLVNTNDPTDNKYYRRKLWRLRKIRDRSGQRSSELYDRLKWKYGRRSLRTKLLVKSYIKDRVSSIFEIGNCGENATRNVIRLIKKVKLLPRQSMTISRISLASDHAFVKATFEDQHRNASFTRIVDSWYSEKLMREKPHTTAMKDMGYPVTGPKNSYPATFSFKFDRDKQEKYQSMFSDIDKDLQSDFGHLQQESDQHWKKINKTRIRENK